MTHEKLTQIAIQWLKKRHRCKVVFSEFRIRKSKEIPDAIGWTSNGHSIVIECKTSRSDFQADFKKLRHKKPLEAIGYQRWYLTPSGLLNPIEIPNGWGLVEYTSSRYLIKRKPDINFISTQSMLNEMKLLLAACRRYELGIGFNTDTCKFTPMPRRRKKI